MVWGQSEFKYNKKKFVITVTRLKFCLDLFNFANKLKKCSNIW